MNDSKRSPMTGTDPFLNAGDFQEDLGMFEAATHAAPIELVEVPLKTVLFAPDDSNQDPTAQRVSQLLAQAVGAQLVEVAQLKTAAALQDTKQKHGADLLVMPVPFGADFTELREESLGDVVDRVLATTLPILAVRQLMEESEVRSCLRNVIVPLSPENPRSDAALSWASRILAHGGQLTIVEIADADLRAEASHLRDPSEPAGLTASERVNRVLTRHFAGSIAAIQRRSLEVGFQIQVLSSPGRFVDSTLAQLRDAPGLVIVAGSADRRSDSYHHEADLILDSRYPVLIV